ncbi:MAG: EAL domain-containing protein, partial [Rhodoferax sp.]|nr:EAL domain-containing protein [Rhodoferax sp.]
TNTQARGVVQAVVQLAHVLGKRVVAEGVETAEQRDVLVALGCDELQGFFFARPMAPEKLIDDEATAPVPFSPSTFVEA